MDFVSRVQEINPEISEVDMHLLEMASCRSRGHMVVIEVGLNVTVRTYFVLNLFCRIIIKFNSLLIPSPFLQNGSVKFAR